MKKLISIFTSLLALVLVLTACSSKSDTKSEKKENVTVKVGEDVDISKEGVIARKAGQSYLENLVIESNFDKNTPGTYEAIYKVEIDGKEHKRTRTITVTE